MQIHNMPDIVIGLNQVERVKIKYHIKKWQDSGKSMWKLASIAGVSRQQMYAMINRNSYRLCVLANLQLAFKTELFDDEQLEQMLVPVRLTLAATRPLRNKNEFQAPPEQFPTATDFLMEKCAGD
jgi:hypothetical protein